LDSGPDSGLLSSKDNKKQVELNLTETYEDEPVLDLKEKEPIDVNDEEPLELKEEVSKDLNEDIVDGVPLNVSPTSDSIVLLEDPLTLSSSIVDTLSSDEPQPSTHKDSSEEEEKSIDLKEEESLELKEEALLVLKEEVPLDLKEEEEILGLKEEVVDLKEKEPLDLKEEAPLDFKEEETIDFKEEETLELINNEDTLDLREEVLYEKEQVILKEESLEETLGKEEIPESTLSEELLLSSEMVTPYESEKHSIDFQNTDSQEELFDLSLALLKYTKSSKTTTNKEDGLLQDSPVISDDDLDLGHIPDSSMNISDNIPSDPLEEEDILVLNATIEENKQDKTSRELAKKLKSEEPAVDEIVLAPATFKPVEFLLSTLEQRVLKKTNNTKNPYLN
jgi:hypothetical protein